MTKALYLEDTYLFSSQGMILQELETEKGHALILDQTIFYPQGGGQPADQGIVVSENNIFRVTDVRLQENGEILHFGSWEHERIPLSNSVTLTVDKERRLLNAKNHSAGHVIDIAMNNLGYRLPHSKSYHFPDSPYVEYVGTIENPEQLKETLEKELQKLISEALVTKSANLNREECETKDITVPSGKEGRTIRFADYMEVGCGGTHIHSSQEIGEVCISKIKSKHGLTKISYKLK